MALKLFLPFLLPIITALVVMLLSLSSRYVAIKWSLAYICPLALILFFSALLVFNPESSAVYLGALSYEFSPNTYFAALLVSFGMFFVVFAVENDPGENLPVVLFAYSAALFLLISRDLISWYLALEGVSLASYALVYLSKRSQTCAEAAIKYFIQGTIGSAFILFSFAWLYGISGEIALDKIAQNAAGLSFFSLIYAFFVIGLAFKLGLVPFHFWVRDVYTEASTAIVLFLSGTLKVALALAGFFFCNMLFSAGNLDVFMILNTKLWWIIVASSIIVASLLAVKQKTIKGLLAYSAIVNTAIFSTAFLDVQVKLARDALFVYLFVYLLLITIIFLLLQNWERLVQLKSHQSLKITELSLVPYDSFSALIACLVFIALTGLPPVLVGLYSKVFVFRYLVEIQAFGLILLIFIGILFSVYYYFEVNKQFIGALITQRTQAAGVTTSRILKIILTLLLCLCLFCSIFPNYLISLL